MAKSSSVLTGLCRRHSGLILLTLAYPLAHFVVCYIPNPFVPSANLALNMIFPVLAGYFYGPVSGALAGVVGTALAAVAGADVYDALSILPHGVMGFVAGTIAGASSQIAAALSLLVGHALNVFVYWCFGMLTFQHVHAMVLGLVTETTIGVVATMLLILLLHTRVYRSAGERW